MFKCHFHSTSPYIQELPNNMEEWLTEQIKYFSQQFDQVMEDKSWFENIFYTRQSRENLLCFNITEWEDLFPSAPY